MNILFVTEKPSLKKLIEDVLKAYPDVFTDNYFFDYIKPVRHLKDDYVRIRKADDKFYIMGDESNISCLKLNCIDIPEDTYLELNDCSFAYKNDSCISDMDMVVCACDPDIDGWLSFIKYLEVHNLDMNSSKVLNALDLTENYLFNKLQNLEDFKDTFEEMKKDLEENNFYKNDIRRREFIILRNESNLLTEEFASYFNIPLELVKQWEKTRTCPDYVYDLLEYKIEQEKLFIKNK